MLKAFWSATYDLIVLTHVNSLIFSKGACFLKIYQEEYLSGQAPENCSSFSVAFRVCKHPSLVHLYKWSFLQLLFRERQDGGGLWLSGAHLIQVVVRSLHVDLGYSSELCELVEGISLQCRLNE